MSRVVPVHVIYNFGDAVSSVSYRPLQREAAPMATIEIAPVPSTEILPQR
jgi:hypothetical protein